MKKNPTLSELVQALNDLNTTETATVTQIKTDAEAKIADLTAKNAVTRKDLQTQLLAHPDAKLMKEMLQPKKAVKGRNTRASEPEDTQFELVAPDGNVIAGYRRQMTSVAPILREQLGEDLSGYVLRKKDTGEIVETTLRYRADRDASKVA